jgi:hypothetical protein
MALEYKCRILAGPNEWQQVCNRSNPGKTGRSCEGADFSWLSSKVSRTLQLTFLVLHLAPRKEQEKRGTSWSFNPGMRCPFTAFPLMSAWVHPAPNLSNSHETPINGGNRMLVPDEQVDFEKKPV